ncbi:MAG: hypothetical protein HRU09_09090 [Oligoflexales bacterium]|nr:hypothetical protein [Oligoflexales bacterium]
MSIWTRTFLLIPLFLMLVINPASSSAGRIKKRKISLNKTKEQFQSDFFEFSAELFKWTAYFASLQRSEDEPVREIYFRVEHEKLMRFTSLFEQYRDVLVAIDSFPDLHQISNISIVPQKVYDFMRDRFAIKSLNAKIDSNLLLIKLVGGEFDFGNGKKAHIDSFIECVKQIDMNAWLPVRKFIRNFQDTLALDARLSQQLGKTLLPLAHYYYQYMDVISRLRIFKELVIDAPYIDIGGKDRDQDIDNVAIRIFQNSGPVMIKLLQQLQEEVIGDSPMTRVLAGLKDSKPMSVSKAERMTRQEIFRQTGRRDLEGFEFRKEPLGIASIAQTHLFKYRGRDYVVKIQKDKIADVFARERENLKRLVSSESIFDKGMKQKIHNTNVGIFEEIDFNNERNNIALGLQSYTNFENNIATVENPPNLSSGFARGSEDVLIMSLAKGEPLGKVMTRSDPDEIKRAYLAIQRLYEQFLITAFDPNLSQNTYHGDLHRENIFFDVNSELVTLIDFGNAGKLNGFMRKSILNILFHTKQTESDEESTIDRAIIELAQVLQDFVLKYNKKRIKESLETGPLIKSYFKVCFNPNNTIQEKIYESRELQAKLLELEAAKRQLELRLNMSDFHIPPEKIDIIQDDIDFIKALVGNCLNGPTSPLLSALASDALISDKLNLVFGELLKNGIAMPKQLIFFNKSKSLLEGILMNLSQTLERSNADYEYVEPDDIYKSVLEKIDINIKENQEELANASGSSEESSVHSLEEDAQP